MANLTPAQKSVVKAMLGTFGSPSSLTTKSALKAGPMMRDTSMGMTAPTGPTLGSRPVIAARRPIGDLASKHIMYWPSAGEARNPDPFAYMRRLQPGTPVVSDPVQTFSPQHVAGMGTDLDGNRTAFVPLPRSRPANPAVAAIGAASSQIPLPRRRPGVLPTEIMRRAAVQQFNPNAILQRSQDPATRAIVARRQGVPGTGGPMLAPQRPAGVTVVDQLRAQGMRPAQAYAAAAAAAHRPTNAAERSQARQDAAESEARALNNFSG